VVPNPEGNAINSNNIEKQFYEQVRILLKNYPVNWNEFRELWKTGNFRLAYLYLKNCTEHLQLKNTIPKNIKTEFYWYIF
jgi:hypothetical protein